MMPCSDKNGAVFDTLDSLNRSENHSLKGQSIVKNLFLIGAVFVIGSKVSENSGLSHVAAGSS